MKTKSIRKLYSVIPLAGVGLLGLAPGLAAQVMPQDNWYLEREFTAGVIGGMKNPQGLSFGPGGRVYVCEPSKNRVQVLDANLL